VSLTTGRHPVVRIRHLRTDRLPIRPLRSSRARPYARPVSWSAQHDVGNNAFGGVLARDGAGIMAGGEVHPDVQSKIDHTRGSGAGLDAGTQSRMGESLGDLSDVTVHTDDTADQLNRSVSARAFATGTDVYFSKGTYNPGSADGDRLIAHELAHVVQQRGAPNAGPLTVSQPGDALENEADDVADSIT
jgi:hypothetical protein